MPAGLIERAQQALQEQQQQPNTGSDKHAAVDAKQQQKAAAASAIGSKRSRCIDAENDVQGALSDEKGLKRADVLANKQQQEKQQSLFSAWGNAGQHKGAGKSRFERMTTTLSGQAFHGARHTDLTKVCL